MPEAEEGNRTEDGKIVQVRSNVASANKWCKCGQMARRKRCCLCGQMLQMLTNVACSENCCKSRGRRKGNERAEIRNITMKNHENQERERKRKWKGKCVKKRGKGAWGAIRRVYPVKREGATHTHTSTQKGKNLNVRIEDQIVGQHTVNTCLSENNT